MKDLSTHSMLVVPNKQMEDFMFVMDLNPDGVSLDSEILTVGHKVKLSKANSAVLKVRLPSKPIKHTLLSALKTF